MTHTEQFAEKFCHALKEALNNTEVGKEFTQELLRKSLAKNPNMTKDEWKEIQQQTMMAIFCGMCMERKEFMDDLSQAVWDDLQEMPEEGEA